MTAADKLGKLLRKQAAPAVRTPLWAGPNGAGSNGGVTQGLLARYVVCKERFRVRYVEGLAPAERFDAKMYYGSLWHIAEQVLAGQHVTAVMGREGTKNDRRRQDWDKYMLAYAKQQAVQYPLDREKIDHWYRVARAVFPLYVDYWSKHPDVTGRTPLLQEFAFDVPYRLPSGRSVRLRGKMDAVDIVTRGAAAGVWLFETKTKGDVRPEKMQQQLTDDLQTMLYFVALDTMRSGPIREGQYVAGLETNPLKGVRYNVVRRPLSGGKGNIVRHKSTKNQPEESRDAFYERVASYALAEPQEFFYRWNVVVAPGDVARFRREVLDPLLENLLDDYEWWYYCRTATKLYQQVKELEGTSKDPFDYLDRAKWFPEHRSRMYRISYGVNLSLYEGGETDLDEFLRTGSRVGLERRTVVFPELEEDAV